MTHSPSETSRPVPKYRLGSAKHLINARVIGALICLAIFASLCILLSRNSAIAKDDPQQIPQITISGTVLDNSGKPIFDVVVSVDGTRRTGTLTGPDGTYVVSLPQGGTYTLTASTSGIVFQPPVLSFSNVSANISNANFLGTRSRTFKISGAVADSSGNAVGDVVIRVSDSPQILTLTGPAGSYSFDHLTAGMSYTLVPSRTGLTFDPPTFTIPNLGRNVSGINFVAVPHDKVLISGIVADGAGQPLPDVVVAVSGAEPALTNTGSTGLYSFTVQSGGNYLVAPARNGYTFTPPSLTFSGLTENQSSANFVGAPAPTFTISGAVMDTSGAPMLDVPVVMVGSSNGTIPTGPLGNYSFTVLASGSYTIAPSVPGMAFAPPNRSFTNLSSDQTSVNFVGSSGPVVPSEISPTEKVESMASPSLSPSPSPSPSPSVKPSPEPKPTPEATPKDLEKTNRQKSAEKASTTPALPAPLSKTGPQEKASANQKRLRPRRTRLRRRGKKAARPRRSPKTTPKGKARSRSRRK